MTNLSYRKGEEAVWLLFKAAFLALVERECSLLVNKTIGRPNRVLQHFRSLISQPVDCCETLVLKITAEGESGIFAPDRQTGENVATRGPNVRNETSPPSSLNVKGTQWSSPHSFDKAEIITIYYGHY